MTMAEIDRRRGEANKALKAFRSARDECERDRGRDVSDARPRCMVAQLALSDARRAVEAALREWWAQGCRELASGGPVPEGPPCIVGERPLEECWPPLLGRRS